MEKEKEEKTILWLEDDSKVVDSYQMTLRAYQRVVGKVEFKIHFFSTIDEAALFFFSKSCPRIDCLITDVCVVGAEYDCVAEFLEEVHAVEPQIPIIVMSGWGFDDTYSAMQRPRGVPYYLAVPRLSMGELVQALESLLSENQDR